MPSLTGRVTTKRGDASLRSADTSKSQPIFLLGTLKEFLFEKTHLQTYIAELSVKLWKGPIKLAHIDLCYSYNSR